MFPALADGVFTTREALLHLLELLFLLYGNIFFNLYVYFIISPLWQYFFNLYVYFLIVMVLFFTY